MSNPSTLKQMSGQNEIKTNARWFAAIVFIVFFAYLLFPITTSTDSRWTFYFSMSMIREHNEDIDEYVSLMEPRDFRVTYLNGHIYSYFPLGISFVSVPYVWAVDKLFPLRYQTDLASYLSQHFPDERLAKIEMIEASFISALAAGMFFLLASLRLDKPRAFLLALIFAFATSMLSTASRALWQHGLSALCLTTALFLLLRFPRNKIPLALAGALLGFAYVVRPTNSLSIFFFALYVFINRRKQTALYFIGAAIPIAILMLDSLRIYHTILPPYYLPQRVGTNTDFFNALLANLISPNRGLFISTPIFLASIFGMYLTAKKKRANPSTVEIYLAAVIFAHWVVISSFDNWYGGWSLGPRFFTDMIPYFVYFLIPVFEEKPLWNSTRWKFAFGIALALSAATHVRYVTSIYPMMWNAKPTAIVQAPERVWDVFDLQILRGMCADQLEGGAPGCWLARGK